MKKTILFSVLSISLTIALSLNSAMADCQKKATAERDFIKTNYSKVFNTSGQIITVFTTTPIFLGYHAAAFLAKDRYYELNDLVKLIQDAKSGEGEVLSELHNDLLSARPDMSKGKLAKLIIEANNKDLFCESTTYSGRLLRNLIADGSLENSISSGTAINLQNLSRE